ncbi:PAS domain S-box protein, partial [Methanoregula sp.]|uniref:PAS domain S-box protein n=1 Tax=Methanoregula sp. TaxID=2052170 RepID=UPI0025D8A741
MSITEISRQLRMNRNSVAKYLEILLISGHVEAKQFGTSKVYTLSQRVPVTAMMDFSSDMILLLDDEHRIVQTNDRFLRFTGLSRESVIGQRADEMETSLLRGLPLERIASAGTEGATETIETAVMGSGGEAVFSTKIISAIFDDGTPGFTILIEDITGRKQA